MRVRFADNLGKDDATHCLKAFGVTVDTSKCVVGAVVDLPDNVVDYLQRKYNALVTLEEVKAVSKASELKGVK